ncbi:hypothetical protein CONCODRAFT_9260 [Conidiobolus coronatus NRRL 28638]|uniref:G-protein coupled receptors family 1 profile domain-containing protein n=1 Tax=Conidiobolus coronatus (strain ATCC 28846 / CBS 209.66 / NRRL 28638) TaxID=796925 RepID=A0A137P0F7_CONC2|nr:hypothetical protein CONCODRAFT_9260 [Conidiobolus coronatus NRRL 28638]|eukprot:KXN68462.1 hypothetical protein CONCODRAFT_9260 [Conidiobolus coronatus NRRL 28638]
MNEDEFSKIQAEAYPYNIILSSISTVASACAIVFCLLMIVSIYKIGWKKLDCSMKLAGVTVIFDLLEGIVGLVLSICCLLNLDGYLKYKLGCHLVYLFIILVDLTSFNLTGIVALERYLIIVRGVKLSNNYLFLIIGVFTIINVSGCVIGIYYDSIGILPAAVYCFLKYDNIGGISSQIIALFSNATSVSMIYFCYMKIMMQRVVQLGELRELFPGKYESITKQRNMTIIKSSILILTSTIANAPYLLITVISMFHPDLFTPLLDTIRTAFVMLNMVTNSLLLLVMRSDLLNELFN